MAQVSYQRKESAAVIEEPPIATAMASKFKGIDIKSKIASKRDESVDISQINLG